MNSFPCRVFALPLSPYHRYGHVLFADFELRPNRHHWIKGLRNRLHGEYGIGVMVKVEESKEVMTFFKSMKNDRTKC